MQVSRAPPVAPVCPVCAEALADLFKDYSRARTRTLTLLFDAPRVEILRSPLENENTRVYSIKETALLE